MPGLEERQLKESALWAHPALTGNSIIVNREFLENNRVGTVFGGKPEVGVTIEELLAREAE